MNKKGFTLIEIIAVIIIIGVVMLITIPAVSKYVVSTRKSSYVSDISAYMESAKGGFIGKDFGEYPESNELTVIPIESLTLEKNDTKSSPFGKFILEKTYVVVVPARNTYDYYGYFIDDIGYGVVNKKTTEISKGIIQEIDADEIFTLSSLRNKNNQLTYNGKKYLFCGNKKNNAFLMCLI